MSMLTVRLTEAEALAAGNSLCQMLADAITALCDQYDIEQVGDGTVRLDQVAGGVTPELAATLKSFLPYATAGEKLNTALGRTTPDDFAAVVAHVDQVTARLDDVIRDA